MQVTILFILKIALLVSLWALILVALRTMARDIGAGSGSLFKRKKQTVPQPIPIPTPPGPVQPNQARISVTGLLVTSGPLAGRTVPLLPNRPLTIGRSTNCDLVLPDDFASSRHTQVRRQGTEWIIEDLESRNGTFVNEQPVTSLETINSGDTIRVGRTVLRVQ